MKRFAILFLFIAALLAAGAARAQSGRTFYIDHASGNNANPGTKASPWQSHPYMQANSTCRSNNNVAPTYTHQTGDHFIFKGGVTWPNACLAMVIAAGGTSASTVPSANAAPTINGADYYGVDVTWFTGGSFTRPLFDSAGGLPTGPDFGAMIVDNGSNYVTFDDIELARNNIQGGNQTGCTMDMVGPIGIVIDRMYLHDWTITNYAFNGDHWTGSICGAANGNPSGINIYNTEQSDKNTTSPLPMGTCAFRIGDYAWNNCHDVAEGLLDFWGNVHDSQIHDLDGNSATAANSGNFHTNTTENIYDQGALSFYNNYEFNNDTGFNQVCPGVAFYNNVIWKQFNSGSHSGYEIALDTNCGASSGTLTYFYNNTIDTTQDSLGGYSCIAIVPRPPTYQSGLVTLKNNLCIGSGISTSGATVSPVLSNNPNPSSAPGYTAANKYAPTSGTGITVGAGANLSGSCSGVLSQLCFDAEGAPWYGASYFARPSTWDAGAYQWPLSGAGNPIDSPSPTSLTFSTQTTGTSSSPQTVTLTNTGSATDAISGIGITGANASQFTQTNNCPSALPPGNSCQINTTFSPTSAGSLVANVSITDTANPSGAAIVSLSGTGQAPGLFSHVSSSTAPGKFTSSATCSVTLASTPASGSTTTFEVYAFNSSFSAAGLPTVADGAANSFTGTTSSPGGTGTSGQISIFHLLNTPGGASATITATFGASVSQLACWAQNEQVASGYTVSLDADAVGTGTTGTAVNTPTLTPATAQEHVVAVGAPDTSAISAVSAPMTGTDNIYEPSAGAPFGAADAWVENQTSAINPSMTMAASDAWVSMVAAYKATATGSVPTISSLSITSGNEGASVTITGTNFGASQGASTVQINSTAVTCGSWSATSLGCTIPSPSSTGGISVTTTDGTSNSVTFTVTPHLTSLSVTSGPVGTSTVLTGTGFGATQGSSTVALNGTTATATAWSDTGITTTAPAGSTTGNVIVTQGGNASNGITFTVNPHITSLSPTHAVVGAAVAISGTTFGATQGASTVKFNGTAATCTSWSDLLLSCPVPSATTGNVVVHNGTDSNGVSFTVDSPVSTPVIASISPDVGLAGTTVVIVGSNFGSTQSTSTLTFNGVSAAVLSWSSTAISCLSPPGATSGNVLVTVSGVSSNPVPYGVYAFPFIIIGNAK